MTNQYNIRRTIVAGLSALPLLLNAVFNTAQAQIVDPDAWVSIVEKPDPLIENVANIPNDAHIKGMWSAQGDWPIVSVHAILMPNGKVLSYGTDEKGVFVGHNFDEWDPSIGLTDNNSHFTRHSPGYQDSFCSAAAYLPGGKIIISGGNTSKTNSIYSTDASENEDALAFAGAGANMSSDRWYATMITLADGSPIMLGGMQPFKESMGDLIQEALNGGWASMTPEVYDPETNTWRSLFGIDAAGRRLAFGPEYNRTSYVRAWVAPNGLVFGVSAEQMWYLDPTGNGQLTSAGEFKGPYSAQTPINVGATNTTAMYDIGKVLMIGGNGRSWFDNLPASNKVTEIDINNGMPTLTEKASMTHPRRMANAIVLATGEVVVLGGTTSDYKIENAVYAAEIWDPQANEWTVGADASVFRGYHGNATLLPNGTVLSHGGGWPSYEPGLKAQVFYPPYLFKHESGATSLAARPKIKAISGLSYQANDTLQVDMENADQIAQLNLVGVSNSTHAFNPGQRRVPLTFTQDSFRLTATLPNHNLTPPGYYQVVAVSPEGVPSFGTIISIGQGIDAPTVPTTPYTPPEVNAAELPAVTLGQAATFSVNAVNGVTYRWNFGDGTETAFSADPNATHTYSAPGAYIVTLTANENGTSTVNHYLQAVQSSTPKTANQPNSSTPINYEVVAGGADRVWVVNPDNDSVSVLDANTRAVIKTIVVGQSPRAVAVAPDGRIWVTNKKSATLSIISPVTLSVVQTVNLDHASQPHGLAFSPSQNLAFVVLEASGQLVKLNATNATEISRVAVGTHARHLAVNHDTTMVLVSRFITPPLPGESTANIDTSEKGGEVLVVNPSNMAITKTITLKHSDKPDTQIQGAGVPNYLAAPVISPNNTTAWVPSKQDNIKRGTARSAFALDFQNTVRAISSNIDLSTLEEVYLKRIDHDNSSVGSAAVYHPDGVYAFVALETSREVAVIDAIQGFELFKFDVGRAPQGLTISPDGKTLYVQDFMDRSVSSVDLSPLVDKGRIAVAKQGAVYTVPLNEEKLAPSILLGKQLFYDAKDTRLARDSYMSCATCHNDGGSDGRVWDLSSLGEGLRNTIALNGRAGMKHGFLHWSANFDEVQDFEKQIRDLAGGTGLMTDAQYNAGTRNLALGDAKAGVSTELDELAAYVTSLNQFDDSPYSTDNASLSAAATAGKQLYQANNCSICHTTSKLTNSLDATTLSNIGTINALSGNRLNGNLSGIDVPTLRDVWKTAPYLHNGSALTIADAVNAHNGIALSAAEMGQLVQYLREINTDVLASNAAPVVAITAPLNNATLATNAFSLQATASDDVEIERVEFYEGSTIVGIDTTAPYAIALSGVLPGNHQYSAIAYDDEGVETTSATVNIIVNSIPDVPPANAVYCAQEWTTCTIPGNKPAIVWYGADGRAFNREVLTGTFPCRNATFGDPVPHVTKYCSYVYEDELVAPPPVVNVEPTIMMIAPTDGTTFDVGEAITLTATATDSDGNIVRVEFFDGASLVATDTTFPYSTQLNNVTAGVHSYTAKAVDNDGAEALAIPSTITVNTVVTPPPSENIAPTVNLTAPANNAAFDEGDSLTLTATAADSDGTITSVAFYDGATLLFTDTAAPYSIDINNATVGVHSYTAKATDDDGAETTSTAVTVTVNEVTITPPGPVVIPDTPPANAVYCAQEWTTCSIPGNKPAIVWYGVNGTFNREVLTGTFPCRNATFGDPVPGVLKSCSYVYEDEFVAPPPPAENVAPTVSLTAPATVVDEGATVTLTATAADSDGTIASVAFYDGATLLFTDTAAPYSVDITGATVGVHSFTAKATDDDGAETTSTAVTVTVNEVVAPPPVENVAPTVSLTTPATVVDEGTTVTLTATAADSDGTIASVAFYDGATLLFTDTAAPYSVDIPGATVGVHSYTAKATDDDGAETTSTAVTVTVNAVAPPPVENVAPTVSLTAPATVVDEGATVTLTATAADSDGTITSVAFYDGATLLFTDTAAPYSIDINNATVGVHSYTAKATDDDGAETTSTAVTVTVNEVTITPPGPVVIPDTPPANAVYCAQEWTTCSIPGNKPAIVWYGVNGTFNREVLTGTFPCRNATFGDPVPHVTKYCSYVYEDEFVAPPPPAENVAPTVSLTAPANNAVVEEGTTVTLTATAADSDGTIASVAFYDGATLLFTDTAAPYSVDITGATVGVHSFTAKATDDDGAETTSTAVTVTVNEVVAPPPAENVAPTVSLTTPATVVDEGATVTLTATAADSDGTIAGVAFYDGATLLFTDTAAPYSIDINNATVGVHSYTAKATDDDGAETTSTAVTVTVNAVAPPPVENVAPTVSLTAPATVVDEGATVTLTATAADSDGTIAGVAFYDGATLLFTDTAAPYSIDINNATVGVHSYTAKATDDDGAETTSTAVTVTVNEVTITPPGPVVIPDTPPANAVYCAQEWTTCSIPGNKPAIVWYGVNGTFNREVLTGTFPCRNATFGDPVPGVLKSCSYVYEDEFVAPPPPAENIAPTVSLTAPANNAVVEEGTTVTLTATAADSDGTIASVAFYDGATLLFTDTAAPYSVDITGATVGVHSFTAKATDDDGAETTSTAVTVTVNEVVAPPPAENVAPTVSLTTPATVVEEGTTVTLTATAADSDGTIASVAFYDGATLLFTDTAAPFSIDINNATVGVHSYTAKATDDDGAETTSTALTVTVNEVTVTPPPTIFPDTPPTNAVYCAREWTTCVIPAGRSVMVWYGADGRAFNRKQLTGTFACRNSTFGDPVPHVTKYCSYIFIDE